jgi:hypothetical protein
MGGRRYWSVLAHRNTRLAFCAGACFAADAELVGDGGTSVTASSIVVPKATVVAIVHVLLAEASALEKAAAAAALAEARLATGIAHELVASAVRARVGAADKWRAFLCWAAAPEQSELFSRAASECGVSSLAEVRSYAHVLAGKKKMPRTGAVFGSPPPAALGLQRRLEAWWAAVAPAGHVRLLRRGLGALVAAHEAFTSAADEEDEEQIAAEAAAEERRKEAAAAAAAAAAREAARQSAEAAARRAAEVSEAARRQAQIDDARRRMVSEAVARAREAAEAERREDAAAAAASATASSLAMAAAAAGAPRRGPADDDFRRRGAVPSSSSASEAGPTAATAAARAQVPGNSVVSFSGRPLRTAS